MIQPNDLRIGNFVKTKDKIFKVFKIVVYAGKPEKIKTNLVALWRENEYQHKGFDKIEPILLTPVVLEKCGFKKVSKNKAEDYQWIYEISYKGNIIELSVGYYDGEHHTFLWSGDCLKHIMWLHQLQNLYYSLTGSELEIVW